MTEKKARLRSILILLLSLVGMLAVSCTSRWGIGASPDSIVYLGAADNLTQGMGLSVPFGNPVNAPMIFYPPLYPVLLAVMKAIGFGLLSGARILQILLFGLNLILVGWILGKILPDNFWLPLVGTLIVLSSQTMLLIHSMAWSEGLFLTFMLLSLFPLAEYFEQNKRRYLYFSAAATALALLTRYIGVSLFFTGTASLLLLNRRTNRQKAIDVLTFGCISCLPLFLWITRNFLAFGNTIGREFIFHPLNKEDIIQLVFTLSRWLMLPARLSSIVIALILLSGLIYLLGLFIYQDRQQSQKRLPNGQEQLGQGRVAVPYFIKILIGFSLIYISNLFLSISFLDANTVLDERILFPVYISGVVVMVYLFGSIAPTDRFHRLAVFPLGLILVVLSLGNLWKGSSWVIRSQADGIGLTSLKWRQSEMIQNIDQLPVEATISSNAPETVYLHTGRRTQFLPRGINSVTQSANTNYEAEMRQLEELLERNRAYVAYFTTLQRSSKEEESQLVKDLNLCILFNGLDGRIYTLSGGLTGCQGD